MDHQIGDAKNEEARSPDQKQENANKQERPKPHRRSPTFFIFDPPLKPNGRFGARFSVLEGVAYFISKALDQDWFARVRLFATQAVGAPVADHIDCVVAD